MDRNDANTVLMCEIFKKEREIKKIYESARWNV